MRVMGQSTRATQRSILERMGELEQQFEKILQQLQAVGSFIQNTDARLKELTNRIDVAEMVVDGWLELEEMKGPVQQFLEQKKEEEARVAVEAKKKSLEEGIQQGFVAKGETIGEQSIIVAHFETKDGVILPPGRDQFAIPSIKTSIRTQLIGGAAGVRVMTGGPDDPCLVVDEVYEVNLEKAREVKEAAEKAAAAPAPVEAETQTAEQVLP